MRWARFWLDLLWGMERNRYEYDKGGEEEGGKIEFEIMKKKGRERVLSFINSLYTPLAKSYISHPKPFIYTLQGITSLPAESIPTP